MRIMHYFRYVDGHLHCEGLRVERLAREYGTPLYVYSQKTLEDHYGRLDAVLAPLDNLICYAVKANSNLAVLRTFADLGSGFDIVSAGELERVIAAGGNPARCVFAGVGKTEAEIALALRRGIYAFNVESEAELARIDRVAARLRKRAPVAVRVNPNVDAQTHAKITTGTYENKFGIAFESVLPLYQRAARLKHLRLRGIQMHIGSQLTEVKPFESAVRRVAPLAATLAKKYGIEFFSIGGGIGIVYESALASGQPDWWVTPAAKGLLTPVTYASKLVPLLRPLGLKILVEPGRFLVGNAGILVTRIEYVKKTGEKRFLIVDAAMNDLVRPAFYDAYHEILPLRCRCGAQALFDVVGPICESGDFFCRDRLLPAVDEGEYLALFSAGAYGAVMGSNYNSRPFPPEILVSERRADCVRRRQPLERIWEGERAASWQARPASSRRRPR
ncbi:MAG: Diaminopimelate decarboxylase [Verrucomicrobia bacterium ADurb.Bin006]|jgi:diaminopimelate decarboxylase|nr:MAG: Diaminopimelate decarboxylase [Verrucomicrobia bacterium ADurb.Bin006]